MISLATLVAAALVKPNLFPWPNHISPVQGSVEVKGLRVVADPGLASEAQIAREEFRPIKTNYPLRIRLKQSLAKLGTEGYDLHITQTGVQIEAPHPAGVFYGLQTLRQLIQPDADGLRLPILNIEDRPRFPWRGFMLDVSRHFFPKSDILHFLDLLSQYKINTFHMHLVDDGGWRLQIKRYPNLIGTGAWRLPSDGAFPEYVGLNFPGPSEGNKLYGGFYTQDDIREIVRYATARHINVVPEIEMPGHNLAACMSYPSLVCSPELQAAYQRYSSFVFPNVFCPGKESTFEFIDHVLDEVMTLFPSKVIHIGGDEVDKFLWTHCDDCKKRMADLGLKSPAELQSYFIQRIENYLRAHGRELMGWDEILEGGLAQNAKVMSWRGESGGIEAARLHHEVVMTPWDQCYFDHSNADLPISVPLSYDPAPPAGGPNLSKYVLGAQANIWTETLPHRSDIEDRLFPRILALSQSLWTEKKEPEESFMPRLMAYTPTLYREAPGMHIAGCFVPYTVVQPGDPVDLSSPKLPNCSLRYEFGDRSPSPGSPLVLHPITLTEGQTITFALINQTRIVGDTTSVHAVSLEKIPDRATIAGLIVRHSQGERQRFDSMPSLGESTMESFLAKDLGTGSTAAKGFIRVTDEGRYTIDCGRAGVGLWLSGKQILGNSPSGSFTVHMLPGLYPLEIDAVLRKRDDFRVQISGPGSALHDADGSTMMHDEASQAQD